MLRLDVRRASPPSLEGLRPEAGVSLTHGARGTENGRLPEVRCRRYALDCFDARYHPSIRLSVAPRVDCMAVSCKGKKRTSPNSAPEDRHRMDNEQDAAAQQNAALEAELQRLVSTLLAKGRQECAVATTKGTLLGLSISILEQGLREGWYRDVATTEASPLPC
jgi:hypothetical protein